VKAILTTWNIVERTILESYGARFGAKTMINKVSSDHPQPGTTLSFEVKGFFRYFVLLIYFVLCY